jgi:hypothetical protein
MARSAAAPFESTLSVPAWCSGANICTLKAHFARASIGLIFPKASHRNGFVVSLQSGTLLASQFSECSLVDDQKELIMAKWRIAARRKTALHHANDNAEDTKKSVVRPTIGTGAPTTSRLRYDHRMASPRGWRSSFLSY